MHSELFHISAEVADRWRRLLGDLYSGVDVSASHQEVYHRPNRLIFYSSVLKSSLYHADKNIIAIEHYMKVLKTPFFVFIFQKVCN